MAAATPVCEIFRVGSADWSPELESIYTRRKMRMATNVDWQLD
jgi:hypothetical protein